MLAFCSPCDYACLGPLSLTYWILSCSARTLVLLLLWLIYSCPQRAPKAAGGIAIRGVGGATLPSTRGVGGPTARPRRDALSKGSDAPSANRASKSSAPGRIMPIEMLREFVKNRYIPEQRFLNLEVCST